MTLEEAISAITATVPLAAAGAKPEVKDIVEVTPGGARPKPTDLPAALWADRDLAVAAWLREAKTLLRFHRPDAIVFVDGPHLDKWEVTVADAKMTHREQVSRFSVTAKIGMVFVVKGEEPVAMERPAA